MTLRSYQQEAVERALWARKLEGGSVLSLPVGAGKSYVIAELAKRLNEPVLIFTPSKELLEQDHEKLSAIVPREEIGIFSASKNMKETRFYTLATIQSAYKKPELFSSYRVVIVDECHQVNVKDAQTMYQSLFRAMNAPKVFGFTATPFRMETFSRRLAKNFFEQVTTIKMLTRFSYGLWKNLVYHIGYQDLLQQGYLSPLLYFTKQEVLHERLKLNASETDFDLSYFEEYMKGEERSIVSSVSHAIQTKGHRSALVFCSTIEQADRLARAWNGSGVVAESVSGKTHPKERERIIEGFKTKKIRLVCNVQCLTTGFDHPEIDCIVSLRPTRSVSLWMQMLGRGTRKANGKTACSLYDFSGNTRGIGRLDQIVIQKIEGKWNVSTVSFPGGAHNQELYAFQMSV